MCDMLMLEVSPDTLYLNDKSDLTFFPDPGDVQP